MATFSAITIVVLHLTFIISLLVIASLSRIFGAAKKKKPLYKLFYVAGLLMTVSMVLALVGLDIAPVAYAALGLDVAGLALGCWVTWFYWEWLPRELTRG